MPRFSNKLSKSRKGVGGHGKNKEVGLNRNTSLSLDSPSSTTPQPSKVFTSTKKNIFLHITTMIVINNKNEIRDISLMSNTVNVKIVKRIVYKSTTL